MRDSADQVPQSSGDKRHPKQDQRAKALSENALRDHATRDSRKDSLGSVIDGVAAIGPPIHVDHRGALVEIFPDPRFWEVPIVHAYQTSIRTGTFKGWFAHEKKVDRYHIVCGELMVFLFDDRLESSTRGRGQKLVLSQASQRQVIIPPMVWHLSLNIGNEDAILINLPSEKYNPDRPDRFHLPIDSDDIPIDVRSFFPSAAKQPAELKDL
mgnify:CR=1 FL=1